MGDREANLSAALDALDATEQVAVVIVSHCYETEPVGVTDQPMFLNLAAEIETDLAPLELLNAVKNIEGRLGRKPSSKWAPRVIDIDIILWGDTMMDSERMALPHKEFRNRAFVLAPLAEIAPDARDPVSGLSVRELVNRPEVTGHVTKGRVRFITPK